MVGFIDDVVKKGTLINEISVIGSINDLKAKSEKMAVVCAIGSVTTRKTVIEKLKKNQKLYYPNLIDPSVSYSKYIKMGEGNIICAGTILTTNIELGDFNILNLI